MSAPPTSHTTPLFEEGMLHIPRPLNAFMIYRRDQIVRLRQARSPLINTPARDLSKLVGAAWKAEPEEVQERYRQLSDQAAMDHKLRYPDYKYRPGSKPKSNRRTSTRKAMPVAHDMEVEDDEDCSSSTSATPPPATPAIGISPRRGTMLLPDGQLSLSPSPPQVLELQPKMPLFSLPTDRNAAYEAAFNTGFQYARMIASFGIPLEDIENPYEALFVTPPTIDLAEKDNAVMQVQVSVQVEKAVAAFGALQADIVEQYDEMMATVPELEAPQRPVSSASSRDLQRSTGNDEDSDCFSYMI
ncbi:hypothetical protein BKA62DRAFT_699174 [Auriculariales sp. MPI-PUGE-AT-0066]|nr:hypothetical protein BKA62DRAFT_699174 [Auriculariales sp. MPI-PUGE-AT-0066]